LASIQKAGHDIAAGQAKANKLVAEALDNLAKWVAKLPPALAPATPATSATPAQFLHLWSLGYLQHHQPQKLKLCIHGEARDKAPSDGMHK
jgi:hypothetical protein